LCSPVREFCSATNWSRVSQGSRHTLAVKTDGSLWAWGRANYGQTGVGNASSLNSPVREFCSATNWCATDAGKNHSGAIKTDGSIWMWGQNSSTVGELGTGCGASLTVCSPVREICSSTEWCAISLGQNSTLAMKYRARGF
jgi:alpha-tubulin suppressor-like RCC1 family protein